MTPITTSFDVRINIKRPFFTKNISADDLSKITETSSLKYESLKTVGPQGYSDTAEPSSQQGLDSLSAVMEEMDAIYDEFEDIASKAAEEMNKIVFTYDISLQENEMIANAERALFGSASGVITFAKYQKILSYEQVLNRQISETMASNGGMLNVG